MSYPWWVVFGCLALATGYVFILYRNKDQAFEGKDRKWIYSTLIFLRWVAVFLISFLLLAPFVKMKITHQEQPIAAILLDNSLSMVQNKNFYQAQFKKVIDQFKDKLDGKYQVLTYGFGEKAERDSIDLYDKKITNISNAVKNIDDDLYNQHLVTAVLFSDGIYNEGINPIYTKTSIPFSIHVVKMGDTAVKRDVRISNVAANQFVYLGDKTVFETDIEADECKGENTKVELYKMEGGVQKKLAEASKQIDRNDFVSSFSLMTSCDQPGMQHYRIAVSQLKNEITYKNNVRDIYVDVIDGRKKILIAAVAPHPDITAIKQALETSKNYQVDIDLKGLKINQLKEYQLVILHQIPHSIKNGDEYIKKAEELQLPMLFITGLQTNYSSFNNNQTAITVEKRGENTQDVLPIYSESFESFKISDELKKEISNLPILELPFCSVKLKNSAQILFYQKIESLKTEYPLMAFSDNGTTSKKGFILGEGLWRWRLNQYRTSKNHLLIDELILKSVNYLSAKKDSRKFRVIMEKQLFRENEPIQFDAQLYNDAFEPVNNAVAKLVIKDEKNKEYRYTFTPKGNGYFLNVGLFPSGEYRYTAEVVWGGKNYAVSGKFNVAAQQLEFVNLTADHTLLNTLAAKRNGGSYFPEQLDQLAEKLLQDEQAKTYLYDVYETNPLINLWPILIAIIMLLGLEWLLRKWSGSY